MMLNEIHEQKKQQHTDGGQNAHIIGLKSVTKNLPLSAFLNALPVGSGLLLSFVYLWP